MVARVFLVIALLVVLFSLISGAYAQAPKPAEATPAAKPASVAKEVPTKVEKIEDRLALSQIQALANKRALQEANYKLAMAEVQKIQDGHQEISAALNVAIVNLYKSLGIDSAVYDINVETGAITKIQKPAGK